MHSTAHVQSIIVVMGVIVVASVQIGVATIGAFSLDCSNIRVHLAAGQLRVFGRMFGTSIR